MSDQGESAEGEAADAVVVELAVEGVHVTDDILAEALMAVVGSHSTDIGEASALPEEHVTSEMLAVAVSQPAAQQVSNMQENQNELESIQNVEIHVQGSWTEESLIEAENNEEMDTSTDKESLSRCQEPQSWPLEELAGISAVTSLDTIPLKRCLGCSQYHCFLCPADHFKPNIYSRLKVHFKNHWNRRIFFIDPATQEEIWILRCYHPCTDEKMANGRPQPHYHCPQCNFTNKRRQRFIVHLGKHTPEFVEKYKLMEEMLAEELKEREKEELVQFSDDEEDSEDRNTNNGERTEPFSWPNEVVGMVQSERDLPVQLCADEKCGCQKFHCVLCPVDYFKPTSASKLRVHYAIHWKNRNPNPYKCKKTNKVYYLLRCFQDCGPEKKNEKSNRHGSHFHCPNCPFTTYKPYRISHHISLHDPDLQWKRHIDKLPKPEQIFQYVAGVVQPEYLYFIRGDRDEFLEKLENDTGLSCSVVGENCVLQGSWDALKLARVLLDKLTDPEGDCVKSVQTEKPRTRSVYTQTEAVHILSSELVGNDVRKMSGAAVVLEKLSDSVSRNPSLKSTANTNTTSAIAFEKTAVTPSHSTQNSDQSPRKRGRPKRYIDFIDVPGKPSAEIRITNVNDNLKKTEKDDVSNSPSANIAAKNIEATVSEDETSGKDKGQYESDLTTEDTFIPDAKRRRGRPRKSETPVHDTNILCLDTVASNSDEIGENNTEKILNTSVKRGRGRPRKSEIPTEEIVLAKTNQDEGRNGNSNDTNSVKILGTPLKRGRGRPRRSEIVPVQTETVTADVVECTDNNDLDPDAEKVLHTPVKRCRGRPRKNETHSNETETNDIDIMDGKKRKLNTDEKVNNSNVQDDREVPNISDEEAIIVRVRPSRRSASARLDSILQSMKKKPRSSHDKMDITKSDNERTKKQMEVEGETNALSHEIDKNQQQNHSAGEDIDKTGNDIFSTETYQETLSADETRNLSVVGVTDNESGIGKHKDIGIIPNNTDTSDSIEEKNFPSPVKGSNDKAGIFLNQSDGTSSSTAPEKNRTADVKESSPPAATEVESPESVIVTETSLDTELEPPDMPKQHDPDNPAEEHTRRAEVSNFPADEQNDTCIPPVNCDNSIAEDSMEVSTAEEGMEDPAVGDICQNVSPAPGSSTATRSSPNYKKQVCITSDDDSQDTKQNGFAVNYDESGNLTLTLNISSSPKKRPSAELLRKRETRGRRVIAVERRTCKCGQVFPTFAKLLRHCKETNCQDLVSTSRPFKCTQCEFAAARVSKLEEHVLRKHGTKHLKCPQCPSKFAMEMHLQQHIQCSHNAEFRARMRAKQNQTVVCDLCGKVVKKHRLGEHKRIKHRPADLVVEKEKKYSCDVCDFKTTTRKILEQHKVRLHAEKTLKCKYCVRIFSVNVDLATHVALHHEDAPEADLRLIGYCPVCNKRMLKKTVKHHVNMVHHGIKPYPCSICGKRFATRYMTKAHEEAHKDESERIRRFLCSICGKRFLQSEQYKAHLNTHTGARPFHCPICPSTFTSKLCLNRHKATHKQGKEFTCNQCGKAFKTEKYLKTHMARHGKSQLMACVCGFTVPEQQLFDRHLLKCSVYLGLHTQQKELVTFLVGESMQSTHIEEGSVTLDLENVLQVQTGDNEEISTAYLAEESQLIYVQGEQEVEPKVEPDVGQVRQGYLCGYCDALFFEVEGIQSHMRDAHGVEVTPIVSDEMAS